MAKFTNTPATVEPMIPQEKVEQILADLIAKAGPENLTQIPETLNAILTVLKANMPAPVPTVEIKRKKRAPNANGYRPTGWPAGVARKEFQIWKEMQQAKGRTEKLSPQDYKVERDQGKADIETIAGGVPTDPIVRNNQEFDDESLNVPSVNSEIEQELFAHVGAVPNTNATNESGAGAGAGDASTALDAELNKAPSKGSTKTSGKGNSKKVNAGKGVDSVLS